MTTKFDIGEEVIFIDFIHTKCKRGFIKRIDIESSCVRFNEYNEMISSAVSILYTISCYGYGEYERDENGVFKTEDECKEYLIEEFGLC